MRAVIGANVLVFGLPWHGTPRTLIAHVRAGVVALVSSGAERLPGGIGWLPEPLRVTGFETAAGPTD